MPNILSELTDLAVTVFRSRADANAPTVFGAWGPFHDMDPVLSDAQRFSQFPPIPSQRLTPVVDLMLSEPDLSILRSGPGELDPMVMHPGGGVRMDAAGFVQTLFSSAFFLMYCRRLQNEEGAFVRMVLDGFEELRRATRGDRVRAYSVTGIANVSIPGSAQVALPWGTLRPAPKIQPGSFFLFGRPTTTCILVEECLIPVRFDRAPEPKSSFELSDLPQSRAASLLPLACVLASEDSNPIAAPIAMWSTLIAPFQAGFSFSTSLSLPNFRDTIDIGSRIPSVEEWARIVDREHVPGIDITARRLISAVGHRADRGDALIDAVMAWESLLGTSSEITFRISAALSKLLEKDLSKRRLLKRQLADIYNVRSRLVHGAAMDASTINEACTAAIDVAAKALRVSYRLGGDWLNRSSTERCDTVLLEWP